MNLLLPGSMVCCGGVFCFSKQMITVCTEKILGCSGMHFLNLRNCSTFSWDSLTLSHLVTLMSNFLRSLWMHQSSHCCLHPVLYFIVFFMCWLVLVWNRKIEVSISVYVFEGHIINLCGKVRIIVKFCVYSFKLKQQFSWSVGYIYIAAIGSFFYVPLHNDSLMFYLVFIVTKNILYKTNFCQHKEL